MSDCTRARPLLGTLVEIVAQGPAAEDAVDEAFRAIGEIHELMSYHDPSSDVSRVNRDAAFGDVVVRAHTWRVLEAARAFADASGGRFDITVAPALTALGILPRVAGFPRISGRGDWRDVELPAPNRVRLRRRVRIDLGGIAKGYAVDRAVDVLRSYGVRAARVNAGGDLRVLGGSPHIVRVRRPDAPTVAWPCLRLRSGAAATSAAYFGKRRRRGPATGSIVDPRSRQPYRGERSVTVLASDCLTADALTKVVHADPDAAVAVLVSHAARALVLDSEDGACRAQAFDAAVADTWQHLEIPHG